MSALLASILAQLLPALLGGAVGWLARHVTIPVPAVPGSAIPAATPAGFPPIVQSIEQGFLTYLQQQHADVAAKFLQLLIQGQGSATLNPAAPPKAA